jgi:hypothetical protein
MHACMPRLFMNERNEGLHCRPTGTEQNYSSLAEQNNRRLPPKGLATGSVDSLLSRLLRQITCPHPSLSLCNVAYITSSSTSRCQMVSPRVSLHQATSSSSKEIKLHATERGHEPHQDPPTNVADPSLPSGGRRLAVAGAAVAGQPRGRSKLQSFSFFASRSSESPCRRLQPAKVRRRPLQGRQEVLAHRFQPAAQLMIVHSQEFTGAIYRR